MAGRHDLAWHVRLLGILWIIFGALRIVPALFFLSITRVGIPFLPWQVRGWLGPALVPLGILFTISAAAGIIAGMMVVLGIAAFLNTRGRTVAALARATSGHAALCATVMLVTFNLRLDVWIASGYGVSVAEIHRLLPTWIVPLLSLALLIWSGVVMALIKSKRRLRQK
jgi:hypothetical protein